MVQGHTKQMKAKGHEVKVFKVLKEENYEADNWPHQES